MVYHQHSWSDKCQRGLIEIDERTVIIGNVFKSNDTNAIWTFIGKKHS